MLMKIAGFYIFYALNWVMTLLPLRALYLLSDILFVALYYFPSYRRKVVTRNLRNSFPEKSDEELRVIARRFYRHMADLFTETLKITHMSERQIIRRFRFRDMTLINRLYDEGKDIIAVCSHYNNWEWLSSMPLLSRYTAMTIYKPLTNKYFDRFMIRLRSKFGVVPSPMQSILRELIRRRKENDRTITAFIADQTPGKNDHIYWTSFLNQETAIYTGTEKVAVMLDMPVVFIHIIKVKRGYYEVETRLISEHPKNEPVNAITEKHVRMLEDVIRQQPEYWLWSHRRWKRKKTKENDKDSGGNS